MPNTTSNSPPTSHQRRMQSAAESFNLTKTAPLVEEVRKKFREDALSFAADRLARARHSYVAHGTGVAAESRPAAFSEALTSGLGNVPEQFFQKRSPFATLNPETSTRSVDISKRATVKREFYPATGSGVTIESVPKPYTSTSVQVPSYKSYITLSKNILAPNNKNVLVLPCFDDGQEDDKLTKEMTDEGFYMNNEGRDHEIAYVERCWQLFSYAPEALVKVGITFIDILNYYAMSAEDFERILMENAQSLGGLGPQLITAMMRWKNEAVHTGTRDWDKLVFSLPRSTPAALARASSFRKAWVNVFDTGLSYIATKHVKASHEFGEDNDFEYRHLACRVCHVHECHLHGAMVEDDDADSSPNMRMYVTTGRQAKSDGDALGYKSINYWKKIAPKAGSSYNRPSFVPCNHDGSCEEAQCSCVRNEVTCEKSCGCSKSCPRRFSGCSCSKQQRTCWDNPKCPCFNLSRECDPDVCLRCGAIELLDAANRGRDLDDGKICQNVKIQRGVKKLTILGTSGIAGAGFGLYAAEDIRAEDYLGEYTGELISAEEMVRREFYYKRQGLEYVFNLTGENLPADDGDVDQAIDASRMGNELRFINNASQEFANCVVKIMMCNTVYRIGVFAVVDIASGTELFFHYGFDKEFEKNYRDPSGTTPKSVALARRNSINSVYPDGGEEDDIPLMRRGVRKRKRGPSMESEDSLSDDESVIVMSIR